MDLRAILESIEARLSGMQINGTAVFSAVAIMDPDDSSAAIETLRDSTGRFAAIFHRGNQYVTIQQGRAQITSRKHEVAIMISNADWGKKSAPDGHGAFEVLEAVENELVGGWDESFTVTLSDSTCNPKDADGRTLSRLAYWLPLQVNPRDVEKRSISR